MVPPRKKRNEKKKATAFSAEHYKERLNQLGKVGVIKKKHSESTKNNINEISVRWFK
jgi:hypothetical protein